MAKSIQQKGLVKQSSGPLDGAGPAQHKSQSVQSRGSGINNQNIGVGLNYGQAGLMQQHQGRHGAPHPNAKVYSNASQEIQFP